MEDYTGRICPFCLTEIDGTDIISVCPSCNTPHHRACMEANGGCAAYGCSEKLPEEQQNETVGNTYNADSIQKRLPDTDVNYSVSQFYEGISQLIDPAEKRIAETVAKEKIDKLKKKRKRIKITAITVPVSAVFAAFLFFVFGILLPQLKYQKFVIKYGQETTDKMLSLKAGDTVSFGNYHGSYEWLVLDRQKDSFLLISKEGIDTLPYNTDETEVTWETCTLRKWLNNEFFDIAFSTEEQAIIRTTTVTADRTLEYSTNPGNSTQDKIFLLSFAEAKKYFSDNKSRKCAAGIYARKNGAWLSDTYSVGGCPACWWWLRSPGSESINAARVLADGSLRNNGNDVESSRGCVRPALWIYLEP